MRILSKVTARGQPQWFQPQDLDIPQNFDSGRNFCSLNGGWCSKTVTEDEYIDKLSKNFALWQGITRWIQPRIGLDNNSGKAVCRRPGRQVGYSEISIDSMMKQRLGSWKEDGMERGCGRKKEEEEEERKEERTKKMKEFRRDD